MAKVKPVSKIVTLKLNGNKCLYITAQFYGVIFIVKLVYSFVQCTGTGTVYTFVW